MDLQFCYEIAQIKIRGKVAQGIALDRSHPGLGKSFVCGADIAIGQSWISIRSNKKKHINDFGQLILSDNAQKLYRCESGFLIQMFTFGNETTPFIFIKINQEYNRFDFYINRERYNHFFPDKQDSINTFDHATNQSLLNPVFINNDGIVLHSSGGSIQNKGMIFAAPSGTGKSTLTHLLLSSPGNLFFSEDRIIARRQQSHWNLWGTPWHGSGNIACNKKAPLNALIFLKQASTTTITELAPDKALHRLLQVASIPWYYEEWTSKGLELCEQLLQDIPVYELGFTPDNSAVQAVEELAYTL